MKLDKIKEAIGVDPYFEDGSGVLYNADCLDIMKKMPDKCVDLVLTDPPYGTTACKWDTVVCLQAMWDSLKRIVRKEGTIIFTSTQPFTTILIHSQMDIFKYCLVWEKSKATGFLSANKKPLVAHEDIVIFAQEAVIYNPQKNDGKAYSKSIRKEYSGNGVYGKFNRKKIESDGGRYPRSVLYFKTAESEGKVYHPTQKPIALMQYLIKTYSNKGETVLDFTLGSGTTSVACKELNRNFMGIEINPDYCKIAEKRLFNTQGSLF